MAGYAPVPSSPTAGKRATTHQVVAERYRALEILAWIFRIAALLIVGFTLLSLFGIAALASTVSMMADPMQDTISAASLTILLSIIFGFPMGLAALALFAQADLLLAIRSLEYQSRLMSEYALLTLMATERMQQQQEQQGAAIANLAHSVHHLAQHEQAHAELLQAIAESSRAAALVLHQRLVR